MEEHEEVRYCAEEQPTPDGSAGFMCTLPYNHDGDHAAEDRKLGEIYAVWRREILA